VAGARKPAQNNFRPPAIGMGGSSAPAADSGRPASGDISNELQLKAAKWLFEAAYGKPGQAIQLERAPQVQRTLIVRWMPPDPNDRSNVIEQEPD
jgi:hypothetical protein